jgi:hypothetical protein
MNTATKNTPATEKAAQTHGTVLRGPDGKLYFIPQDKLSAFEVPEKGTEKMEARLPKGEVAAQTTIPSEWMHVGFCLVQHG